MSLSNAIEIILVYEGIGFRAKSQRGANAPLKLLIAINLSFKK